MKGQGSPRSQLCLQIQLPLAALCLPPPSSDGTGACVPLGDGPALSPSTSAGSPGTRLLTGPGSECGKGTRTHITLKQALVGLFSFFFSFYDVIQHDTQGTPGAQGVPSAMTWVTDFGQGLGSLHTESVLWHELPDSPVSLLPPASCLGDLP